MAFLRTIASGARRVTCHLDPGVASHGVLWREAPSKSLHQGFSPFSGQRRAFSSSDPYRALGVDRNASEADIKKAYKKEALRWHPDRNPDNQEEAQKKFSDASSAYEILKNPETRKEYDLTGRVGGGANGMPGGAGGFHHGGMSQADAEQMFRQAFGGANGMGIDQLFQQMLLNQQMQQMQQGGGRGRRPRVLQTGMEVQVKADVGTIHQASRACGIDAENDDRRARCAGKVGTIVETDARDQSIKVRVMVKRGRADEVWFGAGSVDFLPEEETQSFSGQSFGGQMGGMGGMGGMGMGGMGGMGGFRTARQGGCSSRARPAEPPPPKGFDGFFEGVEVAIKSDVESIHEASRASGIDSDNDDRRARCAGKVGTIVDTDSEDKSLKIRVMVKPGRADEVWFGARAAEILQEGAASGSQQGAPAF